MPLRSTWKRLVQKKEKKKNWKKMLSFLRKRLAIIDLFEGCDWSRYISGASASPRPFTNKMGMSPSSTVHDDMHNTNYTVYDIRVAIACGIRGWRNLGWYAWTSSYTIILSMTPNVKTLPAELPGRWLTYFITRSRVSLTVEQRIILHFNRIRASFTEWIPSEIISRWLTKKACLERCYSETML